MRKQMRYSREVRNYARDLYLQVDTDGSVKYNTRQIAEAIKEKFGRACKQLTKETVRLWVKKEGWDNLLKKIYSEALEKAKEEDELKQFSIVTEQVAFVEEMFRANYSITKICTKTIFERLKDLMELCQTPEGRETHIREIVALNQNAQDFIFRVLQIAADVKKSDEIDDKVALEDLRVSWENHKTVN